MSEQRTTHTHTHTPTHTHTLTDQNVVFSSAFIKSHLSGKNSSLISFGVSLSSNRCNYCVPFSLLKGRIIPRVSFLIPAVQTAQVLSKSVWKNRSPFLTVSQRWHLHVSDQKFSTKPWKWTLCINNSQCSWRRWVVRGAFPQVQRLRVITTNVTSSSSIHTNDCLLTFGSFYFH